MTISRLLPGLLVVLALTAPARAQGYGNCVDSARTQQQLNQLTNNLHATPGIPPAVTYNNAVQACQQTESQRFQQQQRDEWQRNASQYQAQQDRQSRIEAERRTRALELPDVPVPANQPGGVAVPGLLGPAGAPGPASSGPAASHGAGAAPRG